MKAVCWMGKEDVRVETVPDPEILSRSDVIVKVTSTAICGSDLHLYNGYMPTMKEYDILGHEFMGEIVEAGPGVEDLNVGDRVVVPFAIGCGKCWSCSNQLWSLCDNSNPNAGQQEEMMSQATSGLFGYSHLYGGYDGGQAQYVRVPYANYGPLKVPEGVPDEKLLFLGDILSTAYQAVEQAGVKEGDVVAVWGCGPVGQLAIHCAKHLFHAEQVFAIDRQPERLQMAEKFSGATAINFEDVNDNVVEELKSRTGGRGPDVCIDAVGMEALGHGVGAVVDYAKQMMRMESDRPNVLRQAILACRKGGTLSIPGVYGGLIDSLPFGMAFGKGLTFKMGQTTVQKYMPILLEKIIAGEIDPSFIITHHAGIDDAKEMYDVFRNRTDNCVKVVMRPNL